MQVITLKYRTSKTSGQVFWKLYTYADQQGKRYERNYGLDVRIDAREIAQSYADKMQWFDFDLVNGMDYQGNYVFALVGNYE